MKDDERRRLVKIKAVRFMTDQAYKIIKEAIVSLALMPGERLKEVVLAKELGVSTTPVKAALAKLQQEGFVEILPFKGAYVAEINEHDLDEIFELRELLEGAAAREAASAFGSEDVQEGEALLEAMSEACNAGDIEGYVKPSRDFHYLFIKKFGNLRMLGILRSFDDQLERARRIAMRSPQSIPVFIQDYKTILKALSKRDANGAEKALLTHIRRTRQIFQQSREDKDNGLVRPGMEITR